LNCGRGSQTVLLAHDLGIKPLRTTFCESLQDRPLPRRALFPEALVILGVAGDQWITYVQLVHDIDIETVHAVLEADKMPEVR
jgi:hypothetical protein